MIDSLRTYTLIELLVVIMIVAILVSLVMPSLETASEASHTSSCASNLRQVGIGISRIFLNKKLPSSLNPFWKEDDLARNYHSNRPYIQYAHFPPPPPPPPPSPPSPSPEDNNSPTPTEGAAKFNLGVEDMLELFSLGCPNVEENPSYELDPINEPKFRSFSFFKGNETRTYLNSWPWLISESSFSTIEDRSQLSNYRHNESVNVYFKDGRVELIKIDDVIFPE